MQKPGLVIKAYVGLPEQEWKTDVSSIDPRHRFDTITGTYETMFKSLCALFVSSTEISCNGCPAVSP